MAVGAEHHSIHCKGGGISKEQTDVVDITDSFTDQNRSGFSRGRQDRFECRLLLVGTIPAGKHSSMNLEACDRLDHLGVRHVDRRSG